MMKQLKLPNASSRSQKEIDPHRALEAKGGYHGDLADPDDVATTALDHLADGPTWMCGSEDPLGPPPFGSATRRAAVLRMSRR